MKIGSTKEKVFDRELYMASVSFSCVWELLKKLKDFRVQIAKKGFNGRIGMMWFYINIMFKVTYLWISMPNVIVVEGQNIPSPQDHRYIC